MTNEAVSVNENVVSLPTTRTKYIALGYDENTHFFYSRESKNIVKTSSFTNAFIFQLAPRWEWVKDYPTGRETVDLERITDVLIQKSKKAGPFDSSRIRGTGVWVDKNRIVVNAGYCLLVDGLQYDLSEIDSHYIYVQTKSRLEEISLEILTKEEGNTIFDACSAFNFRNKGDSFLLAGWITIARIAGALPVRPHLYITGGKGSGKSTLFENILYALLGKVDNSYIYLQGASTEAGIRQTMKCNSIPIIFDEFEVEAATVKRIEAIIELLRNTWSSTGGKIIKGSTLGIAVSYQLAFAACVSSIRIGLKNDADKSRFSILELEPHGDTPEQRKRLFEAVELINPEMESKLLARSVSKVRDVIKNYEIISQIIARSTSQRYGQQTGMLLAGYWVLTHDELITAEEATLLVQDFLEDCKDTRHEDLPDHEQCFQHLMTTKISLKRESKEEGEEHIKLSVADLTVGEAIKSKFWRSELLTYGIRLDEEKDILYIANNHAELQKIYRGTNWANDWSTPFRRYSTIKNTATTTIGSYRGRAVRFVYSKLSLHL